MNSLSKILVAVDGSAYSDKALDSAINLAKKFGSKLYVIGVVYTPSTLGVNKKTVQILERQLQIEAKLLLSKYHSYAKSKHGIEVETILARGYPSSTIVEAAKARDIDLIVLGSRGLGGFKRMFLGSVSSDVVRTAKQPVLVVR